MRVRSLCRFLLPIALLVAGCAPRAATPGPPEASGPGFPVTLTDDDGVEVTLDAPPQRIVTFAPSNTEIVFALGLGDRLVGVSGPYDDYPPAARRIEEVGGAGDFGVDPNVEKVVSLQPDLLLAISGGEQWKERLRDLGIPVFTIDATDLDDLLHDIRTVGRLTGAVEAADRLTSRMQAEVGPDTFIADLLERAGCDSVSASAKSDYPEWSVDDLVRQGPAVYLVSSESGASPRAVARRPGFGAIAAVAEGHVVPIDSDLVSRPGPRVVDGLRLLAEALHPSVSG